MGPAGAISCACNVTFCSRQLKGRPPVFDGTDFVPTHPLSGGESLLESVFTAVAITIGMFVATCVIVLVLGWAGVRAGCTGVDEPRCSSLGLLGP
jgi:hypothetical protein